MQLQKPHLLFTRTSPTADQGATKASLSQRRGCNCSGEIPQATRQMHPSTPSQFVAVAAMAVTLLGADPVWAAPAIHRSQQHLTPPPINPIHLDGYRAQPTRR